MAGSLAWGMVMDGFRPDRYDITGALISARPFAVIMYTPAQADRIQGAAHADQGKARGPKAASSAAGHSGGGSTSVCYSLMVIAVP